MAKKIRNTKVGNETSIVGGVLYFEDARQCHIDDANFVEIIGDGYTKSIRLVSIDNDYVLRVWLDGVGMRKEDLDMQMTLRREVRSNRGHWYAYRRVLGTLHKRYVGTDEKVTQDRLLEVAKAMPST